jgi:hypothetical protein
MICDHERCCSRLGYLQNDGCRRRDRRRSRKGVFPPVQFSFLVSASSLSPAECEGWLEVGSAHQTFECRPRQRFTMESLVKLQMKTSSTLVFRLWTPFVEQIS